MRGLLLLSLGGVSGLSSLLDTTATGTRCVKRNAEFVNLYFATATLEISNLGGLGGYDPDKTPDAVNSCAYCRCDAVTTNPQQGITSDSVCGPVPVPYSGACCQSLNQYGEPPVVLFTNLGVYQGRNISLKVSNASGYEPNNVGWNRINDEFGVLNLIGGTQAGFYFELLYEDDNSPAVLPGFVLTFYDFDMGAGTAAYPDRSIEYVSACGATEVLTSDELFGVPKSLELFNDTRGPFTIANVPTAISDPN
eukprot:7380921-Prymnesium_polylepis.1